MEMTTVVGGISTVKLLVSTGWMIAVGVFLLGAIVSLMVNKRSRVLRAVSVAVVIFGVFYFALVAAMVYLFGSSALPPMG